MAARASWKGFLKVAELVCPVGLYTASSTSDRIALHTINRATGHRVSRQFVDAETGKPVEREDQVKGYEISQDDYVVLEPEEVAAAVPESDKTLSVSAFIDIDDVDQLYLDKPYYLAPADKTAHEAFALLREGMAKKGVAAVAQTVLFRRVRTLLIRPDSAGVVASTLRYDYEVRSAAEAFADVPKIKLNDEMLELAEHIIAKKKGRFDPESFADRYEEALADLVKAKMEGRAIEVRKAPERGNVIDLMQALRESAGAPAKAPKKTASRTKGVAARKTKKKAAKSGGRSRKAA